MGIRYGILAAAAAVLIAAAGAAPAHDRARGGEGVKASPPGAAGLDERAALGYSQAALGRVVRDAVLRNAEGRDIRLSGYRGKPLVVSFVYTGCANSCPIITRTLADAADVAREALGGNSFRMLTIGFDVGVDTPERMASFARKLGAGDVNWDFASGDPATVQRLAEDLGFVFYRSPKGFDHLDQVSVLDADGRVYRQIYGEAFDVPNLVDPLKELVFGTTSPFASVGDLVRKVRLFCTIYDPATGRYRFDYSVFIQLAVGGLIVGLLGIYVVREWWRLRRRRPGKSTA